METDKFFNEINKTLFKGSLSNRQKQGINYKLKAFDKHDNTDDRWRAYMLATSYHETARTMQPIEESGKDAETLGVVYVVDSDWRLINDLRIRDILLANPEEIRENEYRCF